MPIKKPKPFPAPALDHIAEGLRALAVPVADLRPDPDNARTHDERNLASIRASLTRFGQRQPLVVQREGMIVRAGNARLAIAIELGWTHVAALVVDESEIDAAAYGIADNRTAELAGWDDAILSRLVAGLEDADPNLQGMLGFTVEELAKLDTAIEREATPADAPEEFREVDENIDTDHQCPKCGYQWSGGK